MAESFQGMKRSMMVAEISESELGQELCLMGWCHKQRDMGKLCFITVRDRSGELQLVIDENSPSDILAKAQKVRSEYVIACKGVLRERQDPNPEMETGRFELHVSDLRILSESKTPPFYIEDGDVANDSLRLEYRYLDLRRPEMQKNIITRHRVNSFTRQWFNKKGFLEIETPTFIKSTPEGARDYLVPSRIFPGQFFALPQSPQIYKQLLMLAGFDRYMQIARCYRDEDLRADRQPEFTQLDMEMTFVDEEDVYHIMEDYMRGLFQNVLDVKLPETFDRMTWEEAMCQYGSDKPDRRFGMLIHDISDLVADTDFKVFTSTVKTGGIVGTIAIPGGSELGRRKIDDLTKFAQNHGAKGLVWMSYEDEVRGSAVKFLDEEFIARVAERCDAGKGDMFLFIADEKYRALDVLGRLRLEVGKMMELIDEKAWEPLWVVHFPMFEESEEDGRLVASHHPFTMPVLSDYNNPEKKPAEWRANAYDMVLNGYELGSGSIRIYDNELQAKIFELIGFSREEAEARFGFLLKAFDYGVPPHAGIALGLDRLVMLICGSDNIRDVIAFPKVQNSSCLMAKCPAPVDKTQLEDLGIAIIEQKNNEN